MKDVESMDITIHGTRITVPKYADDIILLSGYEDYEEK